jgi:hypothetical protein
VASEEFCSVSGYREGRCIELHANDDEMGHIVFGDCWPSIKRSLIEAERNPFTYTVRVTNVTPSTTKRPSPPIRR